MSSSTATRTGQGYPLTSVRFLLALMVVLHHTAWTFLPVLSGAGMEGLPKTYLIRALFLLTFPISFFFLLSGYVLSMVYLRGGQGIDKRKFFAARFARLYPLYFVMMVVGAPALLAAKIQLHGLSGGLERTAAVVVAQLLVLQGWAPNRILAIDFPSWSLSAEVLFYLCFPVLGVMLWRLRGAGLWAAALAIYAGGQALVWVATPHMNPWVANFWPPLHLSTFALGILLARWQTLQRARNGGADAPVWVANLVLGISVGGVLLSLWLLPRFHVAKPYEHGLLAPVLAGIVWALSGRATWFTKLLTAPGMVALGNASYAVYLIHVPLFGVFQHFGWQTRPALYPLYLALCVGLGLLSFRYFETPVRIWLVGWFESRSKRLELRGTGRLDCDGIVGRTGL